MSDYDEPNFDVDVDDISDISETESVIDVCSQHSGSDTDSEIEEIIDDCNESTRQSNESNLTLNKLTKYEYVSILGTRAQQIAQGAKIFVNIEGLVKPDPVSIAKKEIAEGKIPLKIKRTIPNGAVEYLTIRKNKTKKLLASGK